MTTKTSDATPQAKNGGLVQWALNSMWVYWFVLLAVSLGAAAGIYLIWLKGNM